MIENILKFFVKEAEKQKVEPEIFVQYTRRNPETNLLQEKIVKQQTSANPDYQQWKRLKVKSYDVKKVINNIKEDSFIDHDFPHNNASISDEESEIVFQWKRIPRFVKYCVYSSADTYHNFEKISISNKRLKEALVFMYRTHPTKFKQFLAHDCNQNGLYEFKLYNKGIVENVIIDDYVPVVNSIHPLMVGPVANREIFPMLLEKAVAKICGGYHKIPEQLDELLQILFCGPLRKTKIDELSNTEVVAKTVENTLLNNGVAAFISKNQPKIRNFGISQNQLYHIIHKFSVNVRGQSIQLYELISEKRLAAWNGKFSHNDSEWEKVDPAERAQLFKLLNKNKSFFVSGSDVSRIFDHLIAFDGTDILNKDWIQLSSQVLYPSFAKFQLHRNDQVFLRITAKDCIRTSVIVAKHIGDHQYKFVGSAFHQNTSSVELTLSLKAGQYIICTHHDWILNKEGTYSIFMSSDSHTLLSYPKQGDYPNFLQHLFKSLSEESKKLNPTPPFLTINKFYTIGMLAKTTGFAFVDFSLKGMNQKQAFIEINQKTLISDSWQIIEPHANRKTIQLNKGEQQQLMLIMKTHKYVSQQIVHFPSTAFRLKL